MIAAFSDVDDATSLDFDDKSINYSQTHSKMVKTLK